MIAAVGLDPRSSAVKRFHVGLGIAWLASAIFFALRLPGGPWMLLGCALGTLWYLPLGTLLSLAQIALLVFLHRGGYL